MWTPERIGAAGYPMRPASAPASVLERLTRGILLASGVRAAFDARRHLARADRLLAAPQPAARPALHDSLDAHLAAGVAAARETLGIAPRRLQVAAALAASDGCIVELPTGAGKTLAIALAAGAVASRGTPVHVLTANDYLARRDAESMLPLYAQLGLSVAFVTGQTPAPERRAAHQASVVYCSAREVVFDHLRDRQWIGADPTDLQLQRLGESRQHVCLGGLRFAIVDEADSVLLDEAATPFVLAAPADTADSADIDRALAIARRLAPGLHFETSPRGRTRLLPAGRFFADALLPREGRWRQSLYGGEMLQLALTALHDLQRDRDYVVDAQGVRIVDPLSGRCAEGRRWSGGLHETVERKEGLAPGAGSRDHASITYQSFFQRYLQLGGMSGTVVEARAELAVVYGIRTIAFPDQAPVTRSEARPRAWATEAQRDRAAIALVAEWSAAGRACLVATRTVAQSETMAAAMCQAGLQVTVLNAKTDGDETVTVQRAGAAGAITIATPLAGRGTDIVASADAERAGGLHVLIAFLPPSRRAERQLAGRAGRAGRTGHVARHFALDETLPRGHLPRWLCRVLARSLPVSSEASPRGIVERCAVAAVRRAQQRADVAARLTRSRLPAAQHRLEQALAFTARQPAAIAHRFPRIPQEVTT